MVAVERVKLDDSEAVLPLLERFFAEEGFGVPKVQIRDRLVEVITGAGSAVFLARVGDRPVGVATVTTSSGIEFGLSAELEDLYVLPAARGTGIGSALIDAVREWCRSRGCSLVAVVVTPEGKANHNLVAYYTRRGFHESGRTLLFAPLQPEHAGRIGDWEETETS